MTPPADLRPSPGLLVSAVALLMVAMSLPASALEPKKCSYRQYQGAAVNVRLALNREAITMTTRTNQSQECFQACCTKEVRTGSWCNMATFKANKRANEDNCFLFHCPTELDCPLMEVPEDTNTYNIYKGLGHPPTRRPETMTTTVQTTTSTTTTTSAPTTPTTTQPTSTTSTPTTAPPLPSTTEPPPPTIIIATAPPGTPPTTTTTTAPRTTMGPAPVFTSRKPNKTTKKQNKTTKKGKSHLSITTTTTLAALSSTTSHLAQTETKKVEHEIISLPETTTSATVTTVSPTTKTTSTTSTTTTAATFPMTSRTVSTTTRPTTTTRQTTTTSPTTTTSSTTTTSPTTTTSSTTTTSPTTTTTTTTTTMTSTSPTTTTTQHTTSISTTEPTTTATAQPPSLIIIPKDTLQSHPNFQPGHANLNSSSSRGKVVAEQGVLKGGVVAFMVLGLAVLTLALAVGGRKAMESFDRRHYTRLELNDLHYEI